MAEPLYITSTGAILYHPGRHKILLQLRDDKPWLPFANHWTTFGGAVEPGETPDEAIHRELLEEIGLDVPVRLWRQFDHRQHPGGQMVVVHQYIYVGEVNRDESEIVLNEGQALGFFGRDELAALPVAFGFKPLFEQFFDALRGEAVNLRLTLAAMEDAPLVYRLMREAFAEYEQVLQPPSGVTRETVDDVREAMQAGGAVLVWDGDTPVASARFRLEPDHFYVGRVSVLPAYRRQGVGTAIMDYMERLAQERGYRKMQVGVRMSLAGNLALYQRLGYQLVEVVDHPKGPDRIGTLVKWLDADEGNTAS